MTDRATEFTPEAAIDHLRAQGVVPEDADATARSLGGGVSNHVYQVTWDDGCLVVKRPLPNLAVEDDWPADVDRVHNEAAAIRAYDAVLRDAGVAARVPSVVSETGEPDHVVAIECAPADAKMWKADLLAGRVDASVAATVGEVLGAVHADTATDDAVRERFASKRPFDQLRVDPYHRTTAERNPDVADAIHDEIDRLLDTSRTLVHGDYSPKNVLVGPDTVPWILDFEVAHWGDPAFDTAFMLNHLFIKSIYNHDRHAAYADAADRFWTAYDRGVEWDIERETVAELAVLMLARVDGKSPVEYVERDAVAEALRRVAKRTLRGDAETLDDFASLACEEAEGL
jgi:5-methylthioribose kinase